MARLDTVDVADVGHKVLLYGPPKVAGKTYAAGQVAAFFPGRTIWLDLEHGFITLKQLPKEVQAGINLIQIPDSRLNQLAIRTLDEITRKSGPLTICDVHGRVGARCVDCMKYPHKGELQTINFSELTKDDLIVMDSATQLSYSALALAMKDVEDIDAKPEWDHYARQGLLLSRVFVFMQQSKANWIVISHDIDIDKREKFTKLVPSAGTSNFSKNFAKYFDHVVYMNIQNGKFQQNSNVLKEANVLAGSRTGVNLEVGVTKGIIDLMRTVKGTTGEQAAKATLNSVAKPMAEVAPEAAPKKTVAQVLAEKKAKREAEAAAQN